MGGLACTDQFAVCRWAGDCSVPVAADCGGCAGSAAWPVALSVNWWGDQVVSSAPRRVQVRWSLVCGVARSPRVTRCRPMRGRGRCGRRRVGDGAGRGGGEATDRVAGQPEPAAIARSGTPWPRRAWTAVCCPRTRSESRPVVRGPVGGDGSRFVFCMSAATLTVEGSCGSRSRARCWTTVFSTASARFDQMCHRSATWMAFGAPSRPASA